MAPSGESVVQLRIQLEPVPIPGVIVMDKAELETWRRERWRQGAVQQSTAPDPLWELTADVGGSIDVLHPPAVELSAVAALGRALGGVGFVSLGVHFNLTAPERNDPDDPWPSEHSQHSLMEDLHRTDATFRHQLHEDLGTDIPAATEFLTGPGRRQDGKLVVPARSGTTILLSESDPHIGGLDRPVDLRRLGGGALGRPWVAYGVVLRLERDFPVEQVPTNPPANFTGPWQVCPVVDDEFWEELGRTLRSVASTVGLPPWPLNRARLHNGALGSACEKNWQMPI